MPDAGTPNKKQVTATLWSLIGTSKFKLSAVNGQDITNNFPSLFKLGGVVEPTGKTNHTKNSSPYSQFCLNFTATTLRGDRLPLISFCVSDPPARLLVDYSADCTCPKIRIHKYTISNYTNPYYDNSKQLHVSAVQKQPSSAHIHQKCKKRK
jgi:hypothetical protein